jgi:enterobactin synthetase component F
VPPGVTGDLYIGGVQLGREYLNRPDLTADRFIPNPFGPAGSRMYKTGDVARWRPDGAITFLGRSDHQVKIRGFRIELGEIEAVISSSDDVAQVAVIAREDHPGDKRLVAYVVGRGGHVDVDAIRARAAARLPGYMVPSAIMVLDELPLSANGKLQRNALPAPDRTTGSRTTRAPETPTERAVLGMFADVLQIPAGPDGSTPFGADDDFFALGGHSLLGAQLMNRVRGRFAVDAGLGLLFANPTVAMLAGRIDALTAEASSASIADLGLAPLVTLKRASGSGRPLFCIHPAGGLAWCYRGLAGAIEPAGNVFGLQAHALDPNRPVPASLDEMAAAYIRDIRTVQPEGPYALLGWSVGGIIAHTMAVRLSEEGESVELLAMLDAYPCDRFRNEPPPDERAAFRALLLVAGVDPDRSGAPPLTRDSVMTFLRTSGHPLGALSDAALDGIIRVVQHNSRLVRQHQHRRFAGDVLYFRAALDHQGTTLSPEEWQPYVQGVIDVREVPSMHAHLTGPSATKVIAAALSKRQRR